MDVNELKIIANLLKLGAEKFSRHGCDDFDLSELIPDPEDRRSLMRRYHEWNGDPEEFDPESDYRIVGASLLMKFFSSACENAVKLR